MKHLIKRLNFLLTILVLFGTISSCVHLRSFSRADIPQKQGGISNPALNNHNIELLTYFDNSQIFGGFQFYGDRCFIDISEEEDSDYGKICEIDLQNGHIKASTQRLYRQSLKLLQFNSLQTISRYAYNFYSIDTLSPVGSIDRTEYGLLLLQEQYSICVKRYQYNSSWFRSIVCLDNHFEQKWEFFPNTLKKGVDSFFVYPNVVVNNNIVHCFFNQLGNIYHYGLDFDTGKEIVNELLFASPYQITFSYNNEKTYLPINRSSFLLHSADEAILTNLTGIAIAYKDNSSLAIQYWKWNSDKLSYQKKISALISSQPDSEYIVRFNKPVNNEGIAIVEMESETIDQLFCVDLLDLKLVGSLPFFKTKENQFDRFYFDEEKNQTKFSGKFLIESGDIPAPLDKKPPNFMLIMFDIKTAKEIWKKSFDQNSGVQVYSNPYIWIENKDDEENCIGFDIYNLEGVCVGKIDAKQDLQESWLDYQHKKKVGVLDWIEDYSVVCSVYDSNRVYFITSNGYIYQWNMHS